MKKYLTILCLLVIILPFNIKANAIENEAEKHCFDAAFYARNNPDVVRVYGDRLLEHYLEYGRNEGRAASSYFNLQFYRNRYEDLRNDFGDDLDAYPKHYLEHGKAEGRIAVDIAKERDLTNFAIALQEFKRGAIGLVTAVLVDLDDCGVEEMIVFAEGVPLSQFWASVSFGSMLTVFSEKDGTIISSSVIPDFAHRTHRLYITNMKDLFLIEIDHGVFYDIYRYQDNVLKKEIFLADVTRNEYCYYINKDLSSATQFASILNEYGIINYGVNEEGGFIGIKDANSFIAAISYGENASHHSSRKVMTKDDTARILDFLPDYLEQKPLPDAESEIARINEVLMTDSEAILNQKYKSHSFKVNEVYLGIYDMYYGITAYTDTNLWWYFNGLKRLELEKNTNEIKFSRLYHFEESQLIFAYFEGKDAHHLYFKDGRLFRWRYTPDISKPLEWIDYENEWNFPEYNRWRDFAINEAYWFAGMVSHSIGL